MSSTYEVRQNGVTKENGVYPECFPDEEKRRTLRAAGCRIYVNGKPYTEKKEQGKEER